MKIKLIFTWIITVLFSTIALAQTEIDSEDLKLTNDSIQLPGTLTYIKNVEKQPLVIFVHGSGNVDRNGNQAGAITANYIQQLSNELNKNGIAFYRYDKRTSTKDNMKILMRGVTLLDFVDDVKVAVNNFKEDSRFSSISLIGHSQGSLVALLAITDSIDNYISIAGPASSIDKTIIDQIRTNNGDSLAGIAASHFKELKTEGKIENINPMLFQLFNPQNQPFFKSWMKYSPQDEIKNLNIPVLIINGTKDLQVPVEEAKTLHQANPDSKLVLIENMNHVLKHIEKDEDNFKSYTTPDFSVSEELVNVLVDFIKK
jgi:pimeloyl-ACP methyl ester carboxylesterase